MIVGTIAPRNLISQAQLDVITGVMVVILCILWFIIAWYYFTLRDREQLLDNREFNLEKYANDLDTWERKLKTREITYNALVRYARRLAALDPRLKEQLEKINHDKGE